MDTPLSSGECGIRNPREMCLGIFGPDCESNRIKYGGVTSFILPYGFLV